MSFYHIIYKFLPFFDMHIYYEFLLPNVDFVFSPKCPFEILSVFLKTEINLDVLYT
jgi:hypothetical protein